MRQAQDSDIIKLSMDIRAGQRLLPFKGNDVQVFSKQNLVNGMYKWAGQIIVATNNKRQEINSLMRQMNGRGKEPELGDKIICLHNCWDTLSDNFEPLINGTIGYISSMYMTHMEYTGINNQKFIVPTLVTSIDTDNGYFENIFIDYTALTTGTKFLTPEQEYSIKRRYK